MQEVAALCDDIVIVDKGRVVAAGTPEALRRARLRDARGRLLSPRSATRGDSNDLDRPPVMQKELRESLRDRRTLMNSLLIGPIVAPLFFILILKLALARSVSNEYEPAPVTVVNAGRRAEFRAAAARARTRGQPARGHGGRHPSLDRGQERPRRDLPSRRLSGNASATASPRPCGCTPTAPNSEAGKHGARVRQAIAGYSALVGSLRLQARGVSPTVIQPVVIDDIDVSTPSARATLMLGMLSYVILLATLMGGLYLAIDATAGERERGSLESLLTLPVVREHLIYGKIAATTVMMLVSLALVATSVSFSLKALPLETFGMTANFRARRRVARVRDGRTLRARRRIAS